MQSATADLYRPGIHIEAFQQLPQRPKQQYEPRGLRRRLSSQRRLVCCLTNRFNLL